MNRSIPIHFGPCDSCDGTGVKYRSELGRYFCHSCRSAGRLGAFAGPDGEFGKPTSDRLYSTDPVERVDAIQAFEDGREALTPTGFAVIGALCTPSGYVIARAIDQAGQIQDTWIAPGTEGQVLCRVRPPAPKHFAK